LSVEVFDVRGLQSELIIVDAMGRKVLAQPIEASAGATFTTEFDLSNLGQGIYFVKMGRETRSFVKE
jgi:hypothetical protein